MDIFNYSDMNPNIEKYQLKWHSFNTYLHSCVSSSLHNESYTDVALVTTDGHQIMAHRFVLAYSSQFLQEVLKFQPKVTTSLPLMIVLPPEISFKTLKILIKYMYSGEATVTKDILDSVLKGGEILKVKGLYRPKEEMQGCKRSESVCSSPGISTSGVASSGQPSPSPVAITQEKTVQHPNPTQQKLKTIAPKTITIPRNVIASAMKVKSQPNTSAKVLNYSLNVKQSQPKETLKEKSVGNQVKVISGKTRRETMESEEQNDDEDNKETLQFVVIKDEPIEWSEVSQEMELMDDKSVFSDIEVKHELYSEDSVNSTGEDNEQLYTPLTCELCTETFTLPAEWVRHVQTHTDMLPAKRQRRDMPDGPDDNGSFPPLHCDLCQKYFPTPAEWVQHIQGEHTEFELRLSNNEKKGPKSKEATQEVSAFKVTSQGSLKTYAHRREAL
ncbi:unnamed protein product [Brassicogethes aeneus]|uniref:Uncharacterized protein n=1 Tax=Brassicogethes aeneus TaxID=1431903 RepID=A0A9P0AY06_BRAAE|nr:unnamed protein product [Brassicogethes aeneus]